MRSIALAASVVFISATVAIAQAPLPSPEVKADRTVIFRLSAPKATEVSVNGEWGGGSQALTRDEKGLWSVQVGPLEPDIYSYTFNVDGANVVDPRNSKLKVGRGSVSNLVEVPGDKALLHDMRSVPHGVLHVHGYDSKTLGRSRGLVIYTPPGYDPAANKKYPVVYLLHGSGDDESGWTNVGFAHRILDNLIADQKAMPMIVAMPDGHAAERRPGSDPLANTRAFESDLLGDVIPLVDGTYRTNAVAAQRAIAGLSMGGAQAFFVGMSHLDTFSAVAPFSMGGGGASTVLQQIDSASITPKLKLLWIGCGKQDRLFAANEKLHADLQAKGVPHTWNPTEGAHTWMVWRKYLADVLPLPFRSS